MEPIIVNNFEPIFISTLPDTFLILQSAHFVVHPSVGKIVLHGSRGLAGNYKSESDIDLSLIVEFDANDPWIERESDLEEIFATTFDHWRSLIEVDIALIFELHPCGLTCFSNSYWEKKNSCETITDCFGLYKNQKGFHGIITNAGIRVDRMYPCLKIWQK